MEHYSVCISKDQLSFSAGHFITFEGGACERLHGHNYRVGVEVHGPLNEAHYVIDFRLLHEIAQATLAELDHYVLLPSEHPQIHVTTGQDEVEVRFGDRRWVLPRGDCRLLPVANTTAELLGRHIGQRLKEALQRHTGSSPHLIRVEVEECFGQSAICELHDA